MRGKVVVVVDDTDEIRALIADILTEEGYAVVCAANGVEALAIVDATEPALILLDLQMPVLDGWDVARTLAGRPVPIPIVVLTAAGNGVRHAEELRAAGFVAKPFDLTDLLDTVGAVYRAAVAAAPYSLANPA